MVGAGNKLDVSARDARPVDGEAALATERLSGKTAVFQCEAAIDERARVKDLVATAKIYADLLLNFSG